ncbi:hypothetical protein DXG01_002047, partial [Tephrocybe rancida]
RSRTPDGNDPLDVDLISPGANHRHRSARPSKKDMSIILARKMKARKMKMAKIKASFGRASRVPIPQPASTAPSAEKKAVPASATPQASSPPAVASLSSKETDANSAPTKNLLAPSTTAPSAACTITSVLATSRAPPPPAAPRYPPHTPTTTVTARSLSSIQTQIILAPIQDGTLPALWTSISGPGSPKEKRVPVSTTPQVLPSPPIPHNPPRTLTTSIAAPSLPSPENETTPAPVQHTPRPAHTISVCSVKSAKEKMVPGAATPRASTPPVTPHAMPPIPKAASAPRNALVPTPNEDMDVDPLQLTLGPDNAHVHRAAAPSDLPMKVSVPGTPQDHAVRPPAPAAHLTVDRDPDASAPLPLTDLLAQHRPPCPTPPPHRPAPRPPHPLRGPPYARRTICTSAAHDK